MCTQYSLSGNDWDKFQVVLEAPSFSSTTSITSRVGWTPLNNVHFTYLPRSRALGSICGRVTTPQSICRYH